MDDDEEEDDIAKPRRKKRRRKVSQPPSDQEEDEEVEAPAAPKHADDDELDQDDLDLLLENTGNYRKDQEKRFKRLKRGQGEEDDDDRGLGDIFSDEEQEEQSRPRDEFDDFIEEDEFSDDERRRQEEDEIRTRPSKMKGTSIFSNIAGLDQEKLSEIEEVFGMGEEYDWALEGEDENLAEEEEGAPELRDVFEPGELKARLLTDEDNMIRAKDEPERYQLLRGNLRLDYNLTDEEFALEQEWVASKLEQEKSAFLSMKPDLTVHLKNAVKKVVEFIGREALEPPFIWQHRQDYLVNIKKTASPTPEDNKSEPTEPSYITELLLNHDDLWRVVQLDLEFHGMIEKQKAAQTLYKNLGLFDPVFEEVLKNSKTLVDYQDVMDYLQFKFSVQIRNLSTKDAPVEEETGEVRQTKKHSRFGAYERIRSGDIYELVNDFGLTAAQLGENIEADQRLNFAEDKSDEPLEVAKKYSKNGGENPSASYVTAEQALAAAEQMLAEELFYDPKIRRSLRNSFWQEAKIDIVLTDKGHKKIDELSPYHEFKYAINRTFSELRLIPELYLKMLAAEAEGLVDVRVSYPNYKNTLFEKIFTKFFASDNVSDIAMAWNESRRRILKAASKKIIPLICRNIREDLRADCTRELYFALRKKFSEKLNQAPFKPPGYVMGTTPKVLAITAGMGDFGKDAVIAIIVDESGQPAESLKLGSPLAPEFKSAISEIVKRQGPDVIGLAGFTVNSSKLYTILKEIVASENLVPGGEAGDAKLEVMWVQDEVARLFQNSAKGQSEFPDRTPLGRYCIALGRYLQSPLLEYASLDDEISAIPIHPHQDLLPKEIFKEAVDTAFVDYVNIVGIDINEAIRSTYISRVLEYVAGLGPRKAVGIIQGIQTQGGSLYNRAELITKEITTKNIFFNCSSFLKIPYDSASRKNDEVDVLDATRIHPEDYELARKMAADALELDEEDVASYDASGGVVGHLLSEDADKLNELILSEYGDELEKKFNQKKRMTLEMIKEELLNNYGEKRQPIQHLTDLQVFTMLTGETSETLKSGAVVSVSLRKVTDKFMIGRLPCGIDGNIAGPNITDKRNVHPTSIYSFGQTVRAVVQSINYRDFLVDLTTREHNVREAVERRRRNYDPKKWNFAAEDADRKKVAQKQVSAQKTGRIIKHPLFKPLNGRQAEEELAKMQGGDLIIRPSSRGYDHIAITWKVADQIYQHIDVVETTSRSGEKVLKVGDATFQDLDELIIMYVQAMARKVEEMVANDKFQKGSRNDVEKWLTAYTDANPRRSIYAFCFDHKHPGYFLLCFKTSQKSPVQTWNVKVIPNGYELMGHPYADVASLSNGFKKMFMHAMQGRY